MFRKTLKIKSLETLRSTPLIPEFFPVLNGSQCFGFSSSRS